MTGKDLQKIRLKMGISQEKFARLLDVSVRTVARWESGQAIPDLTAKGIEVVIRERRKK